MRQKIIEEVVIPGGVKCSFEGNAFTCSKGSLSVARELIVLDTKIVVKDNKITLTSSRGNKKTLASIRATIAHLRNMFAGLDNPYVYELEICNVHFPMTVKTEGDNFVVTNFLGEKQKRIAKILPYVKVEISGVKVIVSSPDIESAGQTAANIEKATKISKRDRRVFQDGIFITSKCGRPI